MRSCLPVVLVLVLVLAACCDPGPNATGVLHAAGDPFGTWDFVPDPTSCTNGYDRDFIGVDLTDHVRVVRFLADPAYGYTLVIATGGDIAYPAAVFHAADCATFEVSLTTDPGDDNGDAQSGGFVVACPAPAPNAMIGGVHGSIEFAHCDADSID